MCHTWFWSRGTLPVVTTGISSHLWIALLFFSTDTICVSRQIAGLPVDSEHVLWNDAPCSFQSQILKGTSRYNKEISGRTH